MLQDKIILFLVEFFTGYLLQSFSFVLFVIAFNGARCDLKKYICSSLLMTLSIFVSRNLNLNFGVHTIINVIVLIAITTYFCKIPIKKCTVASLIVTLSMIVIEILNIGLMMTIFTPQVFKANVRNPLWNAVTAIPATTGLFIVAFVFYRIRIRRKPADDKSSE